MADSDVLWRARGMMVTLSPVWLALTFVSLLDFPLSSIPRELLLAELSSRDDGNTKPQCGSGQKGSYDTALHVFALILILVLSTLGTLGLLCLAGTRPLSIG